MAELLHRFIPRVADANGIVYEACAWGEERDDGTWAGWFEFTPETGGPDQVLRTEYETSQPDCDAIAYWATGIEPIYLEGALGRAKR